MKTPERDEIDTRLGVESEEIPLSSGEVPTSGSGSTKKNSRSSVASLLIALAEDAELFHTPDKESFATVPTGRRKETLRVGSRAFKRWLRQRYFEAFGGAPSENALNEAIGTLEAMALYRGAAAPVFTRVARHEDAVYLDLAREDGSVVAVTATGWAIVKDPPVHFWRSPGMGPLPLPERGGRIDELRPFVNVADHDSFVVLVAWLVAALWPAGPFPVLAISGEQGSAKSTASRVCRALVDPSSAEVRLAPKEPRDLMIAAQNAWLLVYDNLSGLPAWLSDALCALATGGGFATRKLTTDADEMLFRAARPIILNGIDQIATRADLADRAVLLNLPAIPEGKRQAEEDFWKAFAAAQPRILGALLDGVSGVVGNISNVKLAKMPRMADFAKVATAAEPAFGWSSGTFMAAYDRNRTTAVSGVLNADLVAQAVIDFMSRLPHGTWEGTATTLLTLLAEHVPDSALRTRAWPQAPNVLSNRLRRAQSHLRTLGIEIERLQDGHRTLRLTRSGPASVSTVSSDTGLATSRTASGPKGSSGRGQFRLRGRQLRAPKGAADAGDAEVRQHDHERQLTHAAENAVLLSDAAGTDAPDASVDGSRHDEDDLDWFEEVV